EKYECVKNIVNSQNFVAEFALHDYPVTEADIVAKGDDAWNAALNTVNIGKFNLGWASIGICTHAFYEAINHAAHRRLYDRYVTDFPHVKRMLVDAYARLVAMKPVGPRAWARADRLPRPRAGVRRPRGAERRAVRRADRRVPCAHDRGPAGRRAAPRPRFPDGARRDLRARRVRPARAGERASLRRRR